MHCINKNNFKQVTVSLINIIISPVIGCLSFSKPVNGLLDPNEDVYNYGQVVTVYCRQGYDLIGDDTVFCSDTGNWVGDMPTCSQRGV